MTVCRDEGSARRSQGTGRVHARRAPAALTALAVTAGLVGLAGLAGAGGAGGQVAAAATQHGTVDVLYAASLEAVLDNSVGPAFERATGYRFSPYPNGSSALASEIKGKTLQGDVFISAGPTINSTLEGAKNGSWVSWYATFATSPLEIAYSPRSRFAAALRTKPWYEVVTEPGFRIGRTDPAEDPKGVLADEAVGVAAKRYHDPALSRITAGAGNEYPEATLVGLVSSGQLDAGFFYAVEAASAHLPAVGLGSLHYGASYTVTVLANAPDEAGAVAFVKYLLSPPSHRLLERGGLRIEPPRLSGPASAVPPGIKRSV